MTAPSPELKAGIPARLAAALADRYLIERELGQGGMATVYLAEDLRHHRKVAIKVLRPDLAAALGPDRFMQEIEIAARLQHPHILGVHDSGQADGFLYYVMPYVEGDSLRERLARQGELPVHEAVRLLSEIADALAHAHGRGVVHRDIEPENVMLSGRHALVMDFGVAKAVNEASGRNRLTTLGVALGTPAYMAPEQASADPHLDHRVDIYALGVVGYELLAGRPPFTGASPQQVLAAHVTQAPELVSMHRPALSPALSTVIMKALEKRPADRWQSAEEMLAQLEPLATPSGGLTPTGTVPVAAITAAPPSRRGVPRWAVVALGLLVLAGAGYGVFRATGKGGAAATGAQSVAVLPFENVDGDSTNRSFSDGVQGEILTDLTRLADLQVTSRTSVQEYRNTKKPVKQIGAELGVRSLLQGQVQRAGNQVHVTVQLVDAASDRQIWAESYDRELTAQNIFTIQGDIARNVAQSLRASFSASETATAEKPPTNNLEALDWYHRGKALFANIGGSNNGPAAESAFERAVALDSNFAGAWAGLAAARSWQVREGATTDTLPARTALNRAVALAPNATETGLAQAYYAYYARGNFDAALGHFRAVARAHPNDVEAISGVGFIARRRRQWAEALDAGQKVSTLDPRNAGAFTNLGVTYLGTRQWTKADEVFHRALIVDPMSEGATVYLLTSMVAGRGDTAAARAVIATLPPGMSAAVREFATATLARFARQYELSNQALDRMPEQVISDRPATLMVKALNNLAAGMGDRAKRLADSSMHIVAALLAKPAQADVFGYRATLFILQGEAEAILGRAQDAVRDGQRATSAVPISRATIRLDPLFDSIRNDPRIQALLKDDAAWVVK